MDVWTIKAKKLRPYLQHKFATAVVCICVCCIWLLWYTPTHQYTISYRN